MISMYRNIIGCGRSAVIKCLFTALGLLLSLFEASAQADSSAVVSDSLVKAVTENNSLPRIYYSSNPKTYTIQSVEVVGADGYDKNVVSNYSGLYAGQEVKVPGPAFSNAIKRYWKQGLFSDVKIYATKIVDNKIWLEISVKQRPRVSDITFSGIKKKDSDHFSSNIGISKGSQISQNMIDRARGIIKKELEVDGYKNADVNITFADDPQKPGYVIVNIDIDKKNKIKIYRINIEGNENVKASKLKFAMKDTKEKHIIPNLFKSKKFVEENYEKDKRLLVDKYNEYGYRDAEILFDTVYQSEKKPKRVDIKIKVNEGRQYFIRNITWVGNTVYPEAYLSQVLGMKKGDVYNQKLLQERLSDDEDAVSGLYLDNGYLFFNVDPIESNIEGDSIDLEMRIYEGRQAVINNVEIHGNEAVFEHVIRRELRTKPGQLFSKSDLQRSARELAATGHFNPEKLDIRPIPNPEEGTVDIVYNLEQKRNDQFELSFGYGQSGVTGSFGVKFTNFSLANIFNKKSYKPLPQGDGQTLQLSYSTNGRYYQCASATFLEPWLGGKKPVSLSGSFFWSKQTDVSSRYFDNSYYDYYNNFSNNTYYNYDSDPDKYIVTLGASLGLGKRLKWPDDYFSLYYELAYRHYKLQDWNFFTLSTGKANNLRAGITFARNSIDNPYYTRRGSSFSLSLQATPPYSLMKDNSNVEALLEKKKNVGLSSEENLKLKQDLYKWVEYYKTEFKAKVFTPISKNQKLVLLTRAEYGFLGYYDKNHRSPFERYYVGGDGTSGTSSTYAMSIVTLRGYKNGYLTPHDDEGLYAGNMYSKVSLELRYPLMLEQAATIYALAFAEAGNCWYDFKDFNPFNLKRSAGAGVRVFLPMLGLLGVDWGYGFDTDLVTGKKSGSNFHLVIGQEF